MAATEAVSQVALRGTANAGRPLEQNEVLMIGLRIPTQDGFLPVHRACRHNLRNNSLRISPIPSLIRKPIIRTSFCSRGLPAFAVPLVCPTTKHIVETRLTLLLPSLCRTRE